MIKTNLIKALMLGVCLSALTTGTAFAQMATSNSASVVNEVQTDLTKALFQKQNEIDQYIFTDHSEEIIDKGITVNYTGVSDEYVEIGISPYTDGNANYFYGIFGKEMVKVVEYDESIMYATTIVEGTGAVEISATTSAGTETDEAGSTSSPSTVVDKGDSDVTTASPADATTKDPEDLVITQKEELALGAPDASTSSDGQSASDGKVYKDSDASTQSSEAVNATDDNVILYATDVNPESADIQTISIDNVEDVKRGTGEDSNGVTAPLMILVIAGGAVIVGGVILVSNKKKNMK